VLPGRCRGVRVLCGSRGDRPGVWWAGGSASGGGDSGGVGEDGELDAVAEGEFLEELATWVLTVASPSPSWAAISALDRPWATARRTSVSLGVSWSRTWRDSGVGLAGRCPVISRRVTAASSRTSPAATERTAAMSERRGASLSRKPLAPARSALRTASSTSKVVSTRTWQCGTAARTRRVASMPSSRGIRTSMSTTSGWSCLAMATAWTPSVASPTTSMSGWAARIMANPSRTSSWSSATRTRITWSPPRPGGRRSP
jgi:hypothetical protein